MKMCLRNWKYRLRRESDTVGKSLSRILTSMVKACENRDCQLEELTDAELAAVDPRVTKEMLGDITIKA